MRELAATTSRRTGTPLSESAIQRALVAQWQTLGTPRSILAHIANGERRDAITAGRLKGLGVLPGVPDLICASPTGGLFFVELKRAGGRPSQAQREVHERLRAAGTEVFTIDDLDEAVALLEARGVLRRAVR